MNQSVCAELLLFFFFFFFFFSFYYKQAGSVFVFYIALDKIRWDMLLCVWFPSALA